MSSARSKKLRRSDITSASVKAGDDSENAPLSSKVNPDGICDFDPTKIEAQCAAILPDSVVLRVA